MKLIKLVEVKKMQIVGGVVILLLIAGGIFGGGMYLRAREDERIEKVIEENFRREIAQIREIKVNSFLLWEGDSLVDANIEGKGRVRFWYGRDMQPRLEQIGDYRTVFECFKPNDLEMKTQWFATNLDLEKGNEHTKLFSVEVERLSDLVTKYDLVYERLNSFPGGKMELLGKSEDYVIMDKLGNIEAKCRLEVQILKN